MFQPTRRTGLLVAAGLVFVLSLILGARVGLERDVMHLLPAGDPTVGDYLEILDHFHGLDQVLLDVSSEGAPFDDATVRVARSLVEELDASAQIRRVRGRTSLGELSAGLEVLREHRANLFSRPVQAAVEQLLGPEAIAGRLDEVKRQLVNFPDPVSARLFELDPLGLDAAFFSLLPSPTGAGEGAQVVDGWVWSGDGEHLLILAEPTTTDLDAGTGEALLAALEKAIASARAETEEVGVRVAHMSRYRAALDNETTVKGDISRTLWVSLLGIIVVLLGAFGLDRRLPLLFVPPLFGGAVAMGALALVYGRVSPLVVGCGSILLGIAIDYAIHLAFRLRHVGPGLEQRSVAVAETARPVFLAAATTGIAFLSLLASDLPGHRQLGVFAAAGVIAAALCTFLVLPVALSGRDTERPSWLAGPLTRVTARALALFRSRRSWVTCVVLVLTAGAVLGMLRLQVESDLERFNALSDATRRDAETVAAVWGEALGRTSVAVRAQSIEEALAVNEGVRLHLQEALAEHRVLAFDSIAGLLPSAGIQQQNRLRWQSFWAGGRVAEVRAVLEDRMAKRGFEPQAVAGFWDRLPEIPEALTVEHLVATPLVAVLEGIVSTSADGEVWVLSHCVIAEGAFDEAAEQIRGELAGVLVADGRRMVARLSGIVYSELKKMSLLSFVLVIVVLVPFTRSLRRPLALITVLVVTFLWALGALGWLGVPINMMNCMLAIFIFGLTVDYAIFLLHACERPQGSSEVVATAVIVSSTTTMVGFAALTLARHPSLHSIGVTTVVGVVCGLGASITIVPLFSSLLDGPRAEH